MHFRHRTVRLLANSKYLQFCTELRTLHDQFSNRIRSVQNYSLFDWSYFPYFSFKDTVYTLIAESLSKVRSFFT